MPWDDPLLCLMRVPALDMEAWNLVVVGFPMPKQAGDAQGVHPTLRQMGGSDMPQGWPFSLFDPINGSYGTFSHTSTNRPSAVAVILPPSNTTAGGSNGSLNCKRPPSPLTGTLWVFPERS